MPTEYDNTNRGALFRNDKEGNEKRPDYRGTLNVGGTDYRISAWLQTAQNGTKYMSLNVQPKEKPAPRPEDGDWQDFDDQVPF